MGSAWDILREYTVIGTFNRPDASGIRGGASIKKPIARPSNYPYDNDAEDQMYGQPAAYGRSGPSSPSSLHHNITPKDVRHTAWNDEVDESMGAPFNIGMSGQGQGGGTMPGATGHGWSDRPIKPWDEDDDESLRNKRTAREDEGMGAWGMHPGVHDVMPPDEIPHNDLPAKKIVLGIVDPEEIVELELPEVAEDGGLHDPDDIGASAYGLPTQITMFASNPFTMGPGGKSMRHSRYTDLGTSWSTKGESAWDGIRNILSLKG